MAAALIFAVRADPVDASAWLFAAFVLGLAAAACAAAWRLPSQRSTAAALDKRLQLEDRVATALQFATDDDEIAGLIVRDAAARVSDVVPAQVFRFDLRVSRRALALPATAAILATVAAIVPEPGRRAVAARLGAQTIAAGSSRLVTNAPRGEQQHGVPHVSSGAAAPATTSPEARTVERKLTQRAGGESAAARDTDARVASLTDRSPDPSSEHAARRTAAQSAAAGAGHDSGKSSSGGGAASSAERRIALAAGEASRSGVGSSGAAVGADTRRRDGGGVSEGGGSNRSAGSPQILEPAAPLSPARYRAAWARVEASLTRNEVPASFRHYLRAYFVAIRPTERE